MEEVFTLQLRYVSGIFSLALALSMTLLANQVSAQSFRCGLGDRPTCLGFGETVCSSTGMCVSSDAACFNQYQCNYEGFTCRSNVTACLNDNADLIDDHNDLVGDYNSLLRSRDDLLAEHNNLVREHSTVRSDLRAYQEVNQELVAETRSLDGQVRALTSLHDVTINCVESAQSLSAAKLCALP